MLYAACACVYFILSTNNHHHPYMDSTTVLFVSVTCVFCSVVFPQLKFMQRMMDFMLAEFSFYNFSTSVRSWVKSSGV